MTYPALEQHSLAAHTPPKPVPHRPACLFSRPKMLRKLGVATTLTASKATREANEPFMVKRVSETSDSNEWMPLTRKAWLMNRVFCGYNHGLYTCFLFLATTTFRVLQKRKVTLHIAIFSDSSQHLKGVSHLYICICNGKGEHPAIQPNSAYIEALDSSAAPPRE